MPDESSKQAAETPPVQAAKRVPLAQRISPAQKSPVAPKAAAVTGAATGKVHQVKGLSDMKDTVVAVITANQDLPPQIRGMLIAQANAMQCKAIRIDAHVFDNGDDWTITAHVKKLF